MSFLTRLLATANPLDDRYYTNVYGTATTAGVPVSADGALKLSTVWACDRLLSETIGSLPALVFERLADGGRQRATNHPLYDVLHRQPNANDTAMEFFDFMTHCAIMRGNALARIIPGPRGFADQLVPLHPDHVRIEALSNGGLRYQVNEPGKAPETLGDQDVLHLKGMSADGRTGVSVVAYAREAFGLGLAAERYGARFFRNSAEPRGVLQSPKPLSPEAAKRLKESWDEMHSGENQHRVAVLEEGLEFKSVGLTNKDSQFLESREFQAEDVCRWFRVPPHMVGLTSKATSWGSGIEQMSLGFVTYTLLPWLVRWQQAISRDLILAPQKYFVEFVVDALLRGDLKARYDAYAIAAGGNAPWMSRNEVRRLENMNPRPGLDDVLVPLNMGGAEAQPGAPAAITAPAPVADHYTHLVHLAAARVVRKEVAALGKAAKRGGEWAAAVAEFYADHAEFVAQTLGINPAAAATYVSGAVETVTAAGPDGLAGAEGARAAGLAALVRNAL